MGWKESEEVAPYAAHSVSGGNGCRLVAKDEVAELAGDATGGGETESVVRQSKAAKGPHNGARSHGVGGGAAVVARVAIGGDPENLAIGVIDNIEVADTVFAERADVIDDVASGWVQL